MLCSQESRAHQQRTVCSARPAPPAAGRGVLQLLLAAPGAATWAAEKDSDGWLPLHYAVQHNNTSAAKLLLGTHPAAAAVPTGGLMGALPAHTAAQRRQLSMLRLLVRAAPQVLTAVDATGYTPLLHAVDYWCAQGAGAAAAAAAAAAGCGLLSLLLAGKE